MDRQLLSWPGLIVMAITSWEILTTAPRLVSQRPQGGAAHQHSGGHLKMLPARLWQDPMGVANQAHESASKSEVRTRQLGRVLNDQLGQGR